ncbi:MAG: thiamine pyrophosphate-binding protein [Oligoflexia bacterium]|nr:thiamine pyrophosphate-binding protein [Oligoflexia bacterium]
MIKLSEYLFSHLTSIGQKHIFFIVGGGNMHLADALGRNPKLQYVCCLNELNLSMAVEGYARYTNQMGVCVLTTGPSGTNAVTGVANAWVDSLPCLFISGQVNVADTILDTGLRQIGLQEINIIDIVKPITKYAAMVTDPNTIRMHLEKAIYLATSGRPGPVWLDIPLNIQGAMIDESKLLPFDPPPATAATPAIEQAQIMQVMEILKNSKRPLLFIGNGVRISGTSQEQFFNLIETLSIPLVTTWGSADLIDEEHPLYVGRGGLFGQRAANFAIQNADAIIAIGTSFSIPQTGYNFKAFARSGKLIIVDIDPQVVAKPRLPTALGVHADAKAFIQEFTTHLQTQNIAKPSWGHWITTTQNWKKNYPVVLPEYYQENPSAINSYAFIDILSQVLTKDDVVVTDMGTSFTCTFQTFKVKQGQRLITSGGMAGMGFGLPGAIGACIANNNQRVICLAGDGGIQMSLQELQTIIAQKLPIKIFVYNNDGYLAIRSMQDNNFKGRYVGSSKDSGVILPDILAIAKAYGFHTEKISSISDAKNKLEQIIANEHSFLCEVVMPANQPIIPRLASRLNANGQMSQSPLEDMFPFLDREELAQNMLIDVWHD